MRKKIVKWTKSLLSMVVVLTMMVVMMPTMALAATQIDLPVRTLPVGASDEYQATDLPASFTADDSITKGDFGQYDGLAIDYKNVAEVTPDAGYSMVAICNLSFPLTGFAGADGAQVTGKVTIPVPDGYDSSTATLKVATGGGLYDPAVKTDSTTSSVTFSVTLTYNTGTQAVSLPESLVEYKIADAPEIDDPIYFPVLLTATDSSVHGGITFSSTRPRLYQEFSGILTPDEGYLCPQQVTVMVNGIALDSGEYSYDSATGRISIPGDKVTGSIEVVAECVVKPVTYEVTVNKGIGSGSYEAGTKVTIQANSAPKGKKFSYWKINSGEIKLTNHKQEVTSFTMPTGNVVVTAIYKNKSENQTPVYKIINGANSEYLRGSNTPIMITCSGPLQKLSGVFVDGKQIGKKNCSASVDGTLLKLRVSYLKKLKIGSHKVRFQYGKVAVVTTIIIKK